MGTYLEYLLSTPDVTGMELSDLTSATNPKRTNFLESVQRELLNRQSSTGVKSVKNIGCYSYVLDKAIYLRDKCSTYLPQDLGLIEDPGAMRLLLDQLFPDGFPDELSI